MHIQDHVDDLREQCLKRPDSFAMFDRSRPWFQPSGWGFTPLGTHRDADTLTRSNWEVITKDLLARFPDAFDVVKTSHWAVGWFDHLAVDTSNDEAMEALAERVCSLAEYPIADESHLSDLEFNEACEVWNGLSVADRVDAIHRSHCRGVNVFSARRDEMPSGDCGALQQYLIEG